MSRRRSRTRQDIRNFQKAQARKRRQRKLTNLGKGGTEQGSKVFKRLAKDI